MCLGVMGKNGGKWKSGQGRETYREGREKKTLGKKERTEGWGCGGVRKSGEEKEEQRERKKRVFNSPMVKLAIDDGWGKSISNRHSCHSWPVHSDL